MLSYGILAPILYPAYVATRGFADGFVSGMQAYDMVVSPIASTAITAVSIIVFIVLPLLGALSLSSFIISKEKTFNPFPVSITPIILSYKAFKIVSPKIGKISDNSIITTKPQRRAEYSLTIPQFFNDFVYHGNDLIEKKELSFESKFFKFILAQVAEGKGNEYEDIYEDYRRDYLSAVTNIFGNDLTELNMHQFNAKYGMFFTKNSEGLYRLIVNGEAPDYKLKFIKEFILMITAIDNKYMDRINYAKELNDINQQALKELSGNKEEFSELIDLEDKRTKEEIEKIRKDSLAEMIDALTNLQHGNLIEVKDD